MRLVKYGEIIYNDSLEIHMIALFVLFLERRSKQRREAEMFNLNNKKTQRKFTVALIIVLIIMMVVPMALAAF